MMRWLFLLTALLLASDETASSSQQFIQALVNDVKHVAARGGYQGPGDIVTSNWSQWAGLRAFSAAKCGTKLAHAVRAASTGTCYGVSGQPGCDIQSTSAGDFDTSSFNTFCTGTTCKISTIYDQTSCGTNCDLTDNNSSAIDFPITTSCVNSKPCLASTSGTTSWLGAYNTATITVSTPYTLVAYQEQTASPGFGDVMTWGGIGTTVGIGFHSSTTGAFGGLAGGTQGSVTLANSTWGALVDEVPSASANASSMIANNGTASTYTGSAITADRLTIGNGSGGATHFTGNITEAGLLSTGSVSSALATNMCSYYGASC